MSKMINYLGEQAAAYYNDRLATLEMLVNENTHPYGVYFADETNPGERIYDAATWGTPTSGDESTRAVSDADDVDLWKFVRVNGYWSSYRNFVETAIEGDDSFTLTPVYPNDVWIRFKNHYTRLLDTAGSRIISNTPLSGFDQYPKCKGMPYYYIRAYGGSIVDNYLRSISGQPRANLYTYSQMLELLKARGDGYAGWCSSDTAFLADLMYIEFGSRNVQAWGSDAANNLQGCNNYYCRFMCTTAENDVESILISPENAKRLVVGSTVNIGDTGNTDVTDNNLSTTYNICYQVKITAIDTTTGRVTVNNSGITFDTSLTTQLSTMAWYTGSCNDVLGSFGGLDPDNTKYPIVYRGVEDPFASYFQLVSDLLVADNVTYICNDPANYADSITSNYEEVGYTNSDTFGYYTTIGIDTDHPSVQMPTTINGSSSTGFCDYYASSAGTRIVSFGGALHYGAYCGFFWFANLSLTGKGWFLSLSL